MKRVLKTALCITALLAVVCPAVYYLLLAGANEIPDGMYSSYEFYPHDNADVLEFKDGVVMSRTCCGDSNWGSYFKSEDGEWIWKYTGHVLVKGTTSLHPDPDPLYFTLHWDRFSLTIERKDGSSEPLQMRRRLFQKVEL
jgi:hypothetical protein